MFANNNGGLYSEPHSYKYSKSQWGIQRGIVHSITREGRLGNFCSVRLMKGMILDNVRMSGPFGHNGLGVYNPLEIGQPVIVGFNDGKMEDAFILGGYTSEGNYDKLYVDGDLQKPNQRGPEGQTFNQPLGHPNRITQPNAFFHVTGINSLDTAYDSPDYGSLAEAYDRQPRPGVIEIRNDAGTRSLYTSGENILFSDSNIYLVANGDRRSSVNHLLQLSARHCARADGLERMQGIRPTSATTESLPSGITPMVAGQEEEPVSTTTAITVSYRIQEERRLCQAYLEASRQNLQRQAEGIARVEDRAQDIPTQSGPEVSDTYNESRRNDKDWQSATNKEPTRWFITAGHRDGKSGTCGAAGTPLPQAPGQSAESWMNEQVLKIMERLAPSYGLQLSIFLPPIGTSWQSVLDRAVQEKANGAGVLEIHFDAGVAGDYRGATGVIPSRKEILPYEDRLAQTFGAFTRNHRNGLYGPNRGVPLVEVGILNAQVEALMRGNDTAAQNAYFEGKARAVLQSLKGGTPR